MRALLRRIPDGVAPILIATAVAGGAGYIVNAVVPLVVKPADYTTFSVLWSVLYLLVAVLGGLQQEVARASRPRSVGDVADLAPARTLAIVGLLVVGVVVLLAGSRLVEAVLGRDAVAAVPAVATAAASYVVVAVLSGLLSGAGRWRLVSLLIALDGLIRIGAVGLLLALQVGVVGLLWGVAVPFPLAPLLLSRPIRRALTGHVQIDVGLRDLTWNAARAVAAAAAGALLVSGFPLLLAATSDATQSRLAGVNLAVNLVRAPLVVVVLALQSYLVVRFRAAGRRARAAATRVLAGLAAVTAVAAALAAVVGPPVLRVFGPAYDLPAWFVAGVVAGSGALGALCVTGTLVLAGGRHARYVAGWVVAAIVTVLLLLAPGEVETRVVMSLTIGPLAGLACHLGGRSRVPDRVRSV